MRRANTLRRFYVNVFRAHVLSVLPSPATNAKKKANADRHNKGWGRTPAFNTLGRINNSIVWTQ